MALSNAFFRNWWNSSLRASRMLDHHFGPTTDLMNTMRLAAATQSALLEELAAPLSKSWLNQLTDSESLVKLANNRYQIRLDVQNFAPEEISVKATEDCIIVEGKHEERQDEQGFISRHFVRRFVLPSGHDRDGIVSSLSADGVLTIQAPIKEVQKDESVKTIPIVQTPAEHEKISDKSEKTEEKPTEK